MSLAVPLNPDLTYIYYHWADVQAAATENAVRLFITILLKTLERNFELFQMLPMPIHLEETRLSVMIRPMTEYLAISSDRKVFLEMSQRVRIMYNRTNKCM